MSEGRDNVVWLAPSATTFSCLCERCLDARDGASFLDAVRVAVVRGELDLDAIVGYVRCPAGHVVVLRRGDRPRALAHDRRQLQLV